MALLAAGMTSIVALVFLVPLGLALRGGAGTWWGLAALALGLVAASVIVVDRIAARAVRSARNLVTAALAVGDGDLSARVQPDGPRELAEAGHAFNRMAD
ncbi:MAG TPA: HAMP domain-containing protein, partial [Micromonosporaceae bacterium]|nr:HAMP domain-containing protein [Micromonosporaceae bacterium]